jgi:hypothetical protein
MWSREFDDHVRIFFLEDENELSSISADSFSTLLSAFARESRLY